MQFYNANSFEVYRYPLKSAESWMMYSKKMKNCFNRRTVNSDCSRRFVYTLWLGLFASYCTCHGHSNTADRVDHMWMLPWVAFPFQSPDLPSMDSMNLYSCTDLCSCNLWPTRNSVYGEYRIVIRSIFFYKMLLIFSPLTNYHRSFENDIIPLWSCGTCTQHC